MYLCPTRQLVDQVAEQATGKYGIEAHAFTGSRANYDAQASSEWLNADAVDITNYGSLFNADPFFEEPNLIILMTLTRSKTLFPRSGRYSSSDRSMRPHLRPWLEQ